MRRITYYDRSTGTNHTVDVKNSDFNRCIDDIRGNGMIATGYVDIGDSGDDGHVDEARSISPSHTNDISGYTTLNYPTPPSSDSFKYFVTEDDLYPDGKWGSRHKKGNKGNKSNEKYSDPCKNIENDEEYNFFNGIRRMKEYS